MYICVLAVIFATNPFKISNCLESFQLLKPSCCSSPSISANSEIFPVIIAALVKAVFQHGDLMRMAVATPANDFRLGACEAPPALVSTHLGEDMTSFLEGYISKCLVVLSICCVDVIALEHLHTFHYYQ